MLPPNIVSLERLGREIEDAEFRLQLWRTRLDRALAVQRARFKSGEDTWSEGREVLGPLQQIVSTLSDLVEALKAARPIVQSERGIAE